MTLKSDYIDILSMVFTATETQPLEIPFRIRCTRGLF